MLRPMTESSPVVRLRQMFEDARQKPLVTALVLTVMLAVLFGAYSIASSSQSNPNDDGANVSNAETTSETEGGFLAEGYAELEGSDNRSSGTNWWGDVPGLLIRLLIVLGLAYGSLRLLNYFTRSGRLGGAQGRALEVVDHLNLGQNRSIYLVRVAGRVLVVGATGNQLNLLSRMTTEDLPEDVRTSAPNFTSQLHSRILRQLGNQGESTDQLEERRKLLRELRDEEALVP